jgi:cytochrome c5
VQGRRTDGVVAAMTLGLLRVACGSDAKLSSDQKRGKRIYEAFCDKCHKLIPPKQHGDDEWIAAADRYGVKLQIQARETALLKAYLTRANDSNF